MEEFKAVMYDENQDDVFLYPEESSKHQGNSCEIIAEIDNNDYLTFEKHFNGKDEIIRYLDKCDGGYKYKYFIKFLIEKDLKFKQEDMIKFSETSN